MRVVLVLIQGFLEQLRKGYLMPLTTFLKEKDVREAFKLQFEKPRVKLQGELLAPPQTKRYLMVGTAFDYLLRLFIKRNYPNATDRPWNAEKAIPFLETLMVSDRLRIPGLDPATGRYYPPSGRKGVATKLVKKGGMIYPLLKREGKVVDVTGRYYPVMMQGRVMDVSIVLYDTPEEDYYIFDEQEKEIFEFPEAPPRIAKDIIARTRVAYADYLTTGEISDDLLGCMFLLAQLDAVYRTGYIDETLGIVDESVVKDLQGLIAITNPDLFKFKELCLLNPSFGIASSMVGGADADLIIDDILIDIKTSKVLEFNLDYFHQLMGYYILSRIGGVDNAPQQPKIERLGIYYARHGVLCAFPIAQVASEDTLEHFTAWFTERATARSPIPFSWLV